MNRRVAQAFQPAGSPDFRVRWTTNRRLESRPNPQAGKPAPRTRHGSWSQCAASKSWGLSMNRPFGVPASAGSDRLKAGLQTSDVPQTGSWPRFASKFWRLSLPRGSRRKKAHFYGAEGGASLRRLTRFMSVLRRRAGISPNSAIGAPRPGNRNLNPGPLGARLFFQPEKCGVCGSCADIHGPCTGDWVR